MMDIDDGTFFYFMFYVSIPISFLLQPLFLRVRSRVLTYTNSLTDQVTRVTRDPPSTAHPTELEASPTSLPHDEDVDVDMAAADEEPKIKPQLRKKKPKKVIPVGRNGLKKRRVEKSRTSFDEKGYMGTSLCFLISCCELHVLGFRIYSLF